MEKVYLAYPCLKNYLFPSDYHFVSNEHFPFTKPKIVVDQRIDEQYSYSINQIQRKKCESLFKLYYNPDQFYESLSDSEIKTNEIDVELDGWQDFIDWFIELHGYGDYQYLETPVKRAKSRKLDTQDLIDFVQYSYVMGTWYKEAWGYQRSKMYECFDSFSDSQEQFFEAVFNALKHYDVGELFAGLIQFFRRAENYHKEKHSVNGHYQSILRKNSYNANKIESFMVNLIETRNDVSKELHLFRSYLCK
jgi:hypothetical protein